jgi:hypothetical protein
MVPVLTRFGRAGVIVDAELGILLRVRPTGDDARAGPTELVSLELDPVIDPGQFTAPPGSIVAESWGEALKAPVRRGRSGRQRPGSRRAVSAC